MWWLCNDGLGFGMDFMKYGGWVDDYLRFFGVKFLIKWWMEFFFFMVV
jgi:hypothetical protein